MLAFQPQGQWARCARELSGVARGTRNRRSFSTRASSRHRVDWRGFAEVLRGLRCRPAAPCKMPRPRRKTSDASGGEGGRQGECCPLWPPNLGFLCDSRNDERHRVSFSFRALQPKGVVPFSGPFSGPFRAARSLEPRSRDAHPPLSLIHI